MCASGSHYENHEMSYLSACLLYLGQVVELCSGKTVEVPLVIAKKQIKPKYFYQLMLNFLERMITQKLQMEIYGGISK